MLVVQILTWLVCVMLSVIKPYICICEACSYNQACMSVTYQSMVFTHGCMVAVWFMLGIHITNMLGLPGLYVCLPSLIKACLKLECLSAMKLTNYCGAHEGDTSFNKPDHESDS